MVEAASGPANGVHIRVTLRVDSIAESTHVLAGIDGEDVQYAGTHGGLDPWIGESLIRRSPSLARDG